MHVTTEQIKTIRPTTAFSFSKWPFSSESCSPGAIVQNGIYTGNKNANNSCTNPINYENAQFFL